MPSDLDIRAKLVRQQQTIQSLQNDLAATEDYIWDLERKIESQRRFGTTDWRFHADPFREWYRRHIEC